jgi:protein ImuB
MGMRPDTLARNARHESGRRKIMTLRATSERSSPRARRILSLWLPSLPTDRIARERSRASFLRQAHDAACVVVVSERGALRLAAVNQAAAALGLKPGLALADARALIGNGAHGLDVVPAEPAADAACLGQLAAWCGRYTPWAAIDGADGLWLDVTGCAHLVGSERRLIDDLATRLGRLGFVVRAAIADTPGAAWALARFGDGNPVVPPGGVRAALDPLSPVALRLPPAVVETLDRLGLRRIAELHALPRDGLAARFGDQVRRRLDQALGLASEPISPRRPVPPHRVHLAFAEPAGADEDVARIARHLLGELCARLAASELGARRLTLTLYRVEGTLLEATIGASRPTRDAKALARLFAPRLETLDPGFGIEAATLEASVVEPLLPAQLALTPAARAAADLADAAEAPDLAPLVDRLANRLGADAVLRLELCESHAPERAMRRLRLVDHPFDPAHRRLGEPRHSGSASWTDAPARPFRLLSCPEPIEVTAPVPDDPPLLFHWRRMVHRVARADGPERLSPEWWRIYRRARPAAPSSPDAACMTAGTRDYYRIEDAGGRRFWVYRAGLFRPGDPPPRWFLHGVFG